VAWQVRRPRFEMETFHTGEGWWFWTLLNDEEVVASTSVAAYNQHWSKETALDCARWLKFHAAEVPIIGGGILEL